MVVLGNSVIERIWRILMSYSLSPLLFKTIEDEGKEEKDLVFEKAINNCSRCRRCTCVYRHYYRNQLIPRTTI